MEIQELFNFPFVDRIVETEKLYNFLRQKEKNTLWINGESGTGKTTFTKNAFVNIQTKTVYVSFNPDSSSTCCLQSIIEGLENISKRKFINFIKTHYIEIFDISKQVSMQLASMNKIDISWFFELIFDTSKQLITMRKEHENLTKVISRYIDSLTKKDELILIIDNFMYCDNESLDLLLSLIKSNLKNRNIKFILITTTSILLKKPEIQNFLTEGLILTYLEITPLKKQDYFVQILLSSFDLTDQDIHMVKDIYKICSGSPEALKIMLRNLFLQGDIEIEDYYQKAKFKQNAIENYITNQIANSQSSNSMKFDEFDTIEQVILQIIMIFESYIHFDFLLDCTLNVLQGLFGALPNIRFEIINKILKLEKIHMVKNEDCFISIYHDLLFYALDNFYKNSIIKKQLCFFILKYIEQNKNLFRPEYFCQVPMEYYLVKLSYLSKNSNWQQKVYKYFEKIYSQNKIIEAKNGFDWLNSEMDLLDSNSKIVIAQCNYECGCYTNAIMIIKILEKEQIDAMKKFDFFYLKGKIENITMQKNKAIESLKTALISASTLDQKIICLNLLYLVLMEIYEKRDEAKQIFNKACELIKSNDHYTLASCCLLRNCMNFYKHEDSNWYYETAFKIAQNYNSNIDFAFVLNNYSFVQIKNGNIDKAYSGFSQTRSILIDTKIHETSYPLVNMALCHLLKKEYEQAKDFLLEAKIWNKSLYVDYVIRIHLATCYYHLFDLRSFNKISQELYDLLQTENIIDGTIIRKIAINLAILFEKSGDAVKAKLCLNRALPFVKGTSSEYRAGVINNRFNNIVSQEICPFCEYYSTTDFEPWGITLSHD